MLQFLQQPQRDEMSSLVRFPSILCTALKSSKCPYPIFCSCDSFNLRRISIIKFESGHQNQTSPHELKILGTFPICQVARFVIGELLKVEGAESTSPLVLQSKIKLPLWSSGLKAKQHLIRHSKRQPSLGGDLWKRIW